MENLIMPYDLGMDYDKAEMWCAQVEKEINAVNELIDKVEKTLSTNDAEPDEITTAIEVTTQPIITKLHDMVTGFGKFMGFLGQMINGSKVQAYQAKETIKQLNH